MSSRIVQCPRCNKNINEHNSFRKSVVNIEYHPNEYREKNFCSIQCIKDYICVNTVQKQEIQKSRIYDWGGGQAGY